VPPQGQAAAVLPTILLQQVQIFPNPTLARSDNVVIGANGTQLGVAVARAGQHSQNARVRAF